LAANETLTVDGTSIALLAGMTQAQVISAINQESNTTGVTASATGADGTGRGNYLTLTSIAYGSQQTINAQSSVMSVSGTTPLLNTSGIGSIEVSDASPTGDSGSGHGTAGLDVKGTIDGEPATGDGQILTGSSSNTNTSGLELKITGTTTGQYGTVTLTKGIASQISSYITQTATGTNGSIQTSITGLQDQITTINANITTAQANIQTEQNDLDSEFADMESTMAKLQEQGTALDSLTGNTSNSSSNSSSSS
jgi:flagellar hook-associated protein 2